MYQYENEKQLKKSTVHSKTAQRKVTDHNYYLKHLLCINPYNLEEKVSTDVGINSDVYLDRNGPAVGSIPHEYGGPLYGWLHGYVRGHIVNKDLGGEGTSDNLFPFSKKTNSNHFHDIECRAKYDYNEFIQKGRDDEKFYYHCWLEGAAITKDCLESPEEVDEIDVKADWYILTPDGKQKSINDGKYEAVQLDPNFDGSEIEPSTERQINTRAEYEKIVEFAQLHSKEIGSLEASDVLKNGWGAHIPKETLLLIAKWAAVVLDIKLNREIFRERRVLLNWFVSNWERIRCIIMNIAFETNELSESEFSIDNDSFPIDGGEEDTFESDDLLLL